MLVGYQGEPGAFSEETALSLLPGARARGFPTFDDLIEAIVNGPIDRALLPVENSIHGPVTRSYDLLWMYPGLTIIGEARMRVVQSLIGLPGTTIDRITEVRSHPVALDQCRRYLATRPAWRRRSVDDTAGAVREMVEGGDPTIAAVASARAASVYGASVLATGIQDDPENFTRFFLIAREPAEPAQAAHACLAMTLPHRVGSLRDALDVFARAGMNLRSLVARPSGEQPFHYRFYCELELGDRQSIDAVLANLAGEVRLLGIY